MHCKETNKQKFCNEGLRLKHMNTKATITGKSASTPQEAAEIKLPDSLPLHPTLVNNNLSSGSFSDSILTPLLSECCRPFILSIKPISSRYFRSCFCSGNQIARSYQTIRSPLELGRWWGHKHSNEICPSRKYCFFICTYTLEKETLRYFPHVQEQMISLLRKTQ